MLLILVRIVSAGLWLIGLIGYFTLPEDWPVAVERMGKIAMWLDRDSLVILLLTLSSAGFAWAVFAPAVQRWWHARKKHPLTLLPAEGIFDVHKRGEVLFHATVTNQSRKMIEDVEVRLIEIAAYKGPVVPLGFPLRLSKSDKTSFNVAPGMPRHLVIFKVCLDSQNDTVSVGPPRLDFGPFGDVEYVSVGPGLHRVDLAAYSRTESPIRSSFAAILNPHGSTMLRLWEPDLPYPFIPSTTESPAPQLPTSPEAGKQP
jgi:hypothetical protein